MNYENKKNLPIPIDGDDVIMSVFGTVLAVICAYGLGLTVGELNSVTLDAFNYATTNALRPIVMGLHGPIIGFIFHVGFSNGWHGSFQITHHYRTLYILALISFSIYCSKVEQSRKLSKELAQTNS